MIKIKSNTVKTIQMELNKSLHKYEIYFINIHSSNLMLCVSPGKKHMHTFLVIMCDHIG